MQDDQDCGKALTKPEIERMLQENTDFVISLPEHWTQEMKCNMRIVLAEAGFAQEGISFVPTSKSLLATRIMHNQEQALHGDTSGSNVSSICKIKNTAFLILHTTPKEDATRMSFTTYKVDDSPLILCSPSSIRYDEKQLEQLFSHFVKS